MIIKKEKPKKDLQVVSSNPHINPIITSNIYKVYFPDNYYIELFT